MTHELDEYFPREDIHLTALDRTQSRLGQDITDSEIAAVPEIMGIESVARVQQLRRTHWIVVHVPFIVVVVMILFAMCLICLGYWRKGTTIMGCDALFAGIVRWILPDARAGLLMVTSKLRDICVYLALGVFIIYLSLTITALH